MKKSIITLLLLVLCGICVAQTDDVGITFEFENGEIIEENSQEYYAFDIMAYASEVGTNFGSAMVYLNYNTVSFGSNIHSCDNITVEKGDLILGDLAQGIPLYDIVNIADNSSSCLAITTSYNFPTLQDEANELPDTAVQYLHIKIQIIDNSGYSGFSFNEYLMQGQQYHSDDITTYAPVIAIDVDNVILPISPSEPELSSYGILKSGPNPFDTHSECIELVLQASRPGELELDVFNIKGQLIRVLFKNVVQKDQLISLSWNGKDSKGNDLTPGVYFYSLIMNRKTEEIKKLILMK